MKLKWINLLLVLLLVFSCGEQEEEDEILDNDLEQFFSIVYEIIGVRALGSDGNFLASGGKREMLFKTTTDLTDPENVPTEILGTFDFVYQSFRNPVSNRVVTQGGYKGDFIILDSESGQTQTDVSTDDPYNVLDPYNDSQDPLDPDEEVEGFTTISFEIEIKDRSCSNSEDCSFFNSLKTVQRVRMVRFPNGEIVMDELDTGFQYYMKPKIRN